MGVSPEQSKRGEPSLLSDWQHFFRYRPGYSWLFGRQAYTLLIYIPFFIHQYSKVFLLRVVLTHSPVCTDIGDCPDQGAGPFILPWRTSFWFTWSHSNPPKCFWKAFLLSSKSTTYLHVIHKLAKGAPDLIIYIVNEDIQYYFSQYRPLGDIICYWSPLGH